MAVTRLAITQRVLRHFNQQDEALAGLPVPMSSTGTSGTGVIVDTKLARATTSDANHFDKRYVEIVADAGAGPAVGDISVVADAGFDNTSALTVLPAFDAAPISSDNYLIYARGLSPTSVAQYINDTLRLTQGPHIWFPSLVPDAEFEAASVIAWAGVNTPPTREFSTTAANSLFGERQLDIVTDGSDQGVASPTFPVTEGESLLVLSTLVDTTDTVSMSLRRTTATAADLKTASTEEPAFTELSFQATATAGTEAVQIRWIAPNSGTTFRISAPVIVQRQGWGAYAAPSWLTVPKAQLVQARTWLQGRASSAADTFVALTAPIGRAPAVAPGWRSDNWLTPNYIMVEALSRPTYFVVQRAYDELSALTGTGGTTNCNEDYVTYSTISRIYRDRGEDANASSWGRKAAEIARAMEYGDTGGVRIVQNPTIAV